VGASLGEWKGVYIRTNLEVYLGAYSHCTRKRLESLGGSLGQAGRECTIECNQECTSERTWEFAMECFCLFYGIWHDV
jgi:hypothetical protein